MTIQSGAEIHTVRATSDNRQCADRQSKTGVVYASDVVVLVESGGQRSHDEGSETLGHRSLAKIRVGRVEIECGPHHGGCCVER